MSFLRKVQTGSFAGFHGNMSSQTAALFVIHGNTVILVKLKFAVLICRAENGQTGGLLSGKIGHGIRCHGQDGSAFYKERNAA